jgi:23S rRNA pseudouridine2605 synthase
VPRPPRTEGPDPGGLRPSPGSRPAPRSRPSPGPAKEEPAAAPPAEERLQRTLARAGLGSRRGSELLIADGRVTVNGRVAELGTRVDPRRDRVAVDGVPIPADPDLRYFALNKPAGVTTTMRDPHAERSLLALLPEGPRVVPVGRLDRETEGLLLLTNDGDLAHRLQHPRHGVEKEYLAEVGGDLSRRAVSELLRGVELEDGPARAVRASVIERGRGRTAVSVVLAEGRKREVRRMLAAIGHPVHRLVRIRMGPVRLGSLPPGATRPLDPDEIAGLYRATGLERASLGSHRSGASTDERPARTGPGARRGRTGSGARPARSRRSGGRSAAPRSGRDST